MGRGEAIALDGLERTLRCTLDQGSHGLGFGQPAEPQVIGIDPGAHQTAIVGLTAPTGEYRWSALLEVRSTKEAKGFGNIGRLHCMAGAVNQILVDHVPGSIPVSAVLIEAPDGLDDGHMHCRGKNAAGIGIAAAAWAINWPMLHKALPVARKLVVERRVWSKGVGGNEAVLGTAAIETRWSEVGQHRADAWAIAKWYVTTPPAQVDLAEQTEAFSGVISGVSRP